MKVAIIDCELLREKERHRFPNLADMKISAWHKSRGDSVRLILSYDESFDEYDKIYVSKVFTNTYVPDWLMADSRTEAGGTGFFYDCAPPLPYEVEHIMPDYHLYDEWVAIQLDSGAKKSKLSYYTDFSIGFLTRGCFRKCEFCVNKNYDRSVPHSPVSEFFDPSRKYLMFLDDNFLACSDWKRIIDEVKATGRKFQFKQGLDERLLTESKMDEIFSWNYHGDMIFAFDNIADRDVIESRLDMIERKYPKKMGKIKFYVLVGFDRNNRYDEDFWINDIKDMFERIKILGKHHVLCYIMRYEKVYESEYSGLYAEVTKWCNVVQFYKKMSFANFLLTMNMYGENKYKGRPDLWLQDGRKKLQPWRHLDLFRENYQDIYSNYFTFIGGGGPFKRLGTTEE